MPFPYQYPMFPPPPINPTIMSTSVVQSTDREQETPIEESQDPIGLESIDLDEGGGGAQRKKPKCRFSPAEDKLLIQSWLNISKDSIVGVDQRADSFWSRIKKNYNEYRNKKLAAKESTQLKARWHRLNAGVQKFVGCYKQAVERKTSGMSENDIFNIALEIYAQDQGEKFTFEHAWRLLKDEQKWAAGASEGSSKRTKISASGAYSSSSNPQSTPTSNEYNPASPTLERPIGQKASKRKEKGKQGESSSANEDNEQFKETMEKKLNHDRF